MAIIGHALGRKLGMNVDCHLGKEHLTEMSRRERDPTGTDHGQGLQSLGNDGRGPIAIDEPIASVVIYIFISSMEY